jgi:GTPase
MARLRRSLDDVRRTRALHRQRRKKAPWPVVALVGYTNAGKSTLFNRLTDSAVIAEDQLFATLDPTMRRVAIPGIGMVILSDTVGFVSDLPTQLVAAFRATLEEVESADLLLHVRDISHAESEAQRADVLDVLLSLGIGEGEGPPMIEVHNKIDRVAPEEREAVLAQAARDGAIAVSAMDGWGLETLKARLTSVLGGGDILRRLEIAAGDGARQSWLHRHARILEQNQHGDVMIYKVSFSEADSNRFDQLPPFA